MEHKFNTAKIVTTWECNLKCSYCCNNDPHVRATFKPIRQSELGNLPHSDFQITGGEPMLPSRFSQTICVLDWLPPDRNVYLYTNGMFFGGRKENFAYANTLKRHGVKGINIGWHKKSGIELGTLVRVDSVVPIRIWVKEGEVKEWMNLFDLRIWKPGECDNINTDRYFLDVRGK